MAKQYSALSVLLLSLSLMLAGASTVLAQTLTTDAPVPQKMWEIILKLAFPLVLTVVGPFVTSFIKTAHPAIKYVVAGFASLLVGVGAGAIPDFPLTMESAGTMGVTGGVIGQKLFITTPTEEGKS